MGIVENDIKTQYVQTLEDWGDRNVQIQSETEVPPKKMKERLWNKYTGLYTSQSTLTGVSQ